MDDKQRIIDYCHSLGLELVGFTQCRRFEELRDFYKDRKIKGNENEFEEQDIDIRINPNHYMEDGKTIISIAFPYLHRFEYADNGFSIYTRGIDYHKVVKSYLNKICEFINGLGGNALGFVDSNTLPERYIAYLSGIGFIGKNNMLITKKYGSYVFLGEIITDLKIMCDSKRNFNEVKKFVECDTCDMCYTKCPTKAISEKNKNCNVCMSYITQKKSIDDTFLKLMNGRIFGCDTCQEICPYNNKIEYSTITEFAPLDFIEDINTESIININNKEFKETLIRTSCGWRGKNTLIRNALIRRYIYENSDISMYKFDSPALKECQNRLLSIDRV